MTSPKPIINICIILVSPAKAMPGVGRTLHLLTKTLIISRLDKLYAIRIVIENSMISISK
jgi:hypothetical protein